ncbi:MAG: outer membrane lipoprotein carrier protein LolA [Rhodospirillaceae bacterium]|nr:MAG: outer membrane lipoprotein carrier protein LolA [Rhodospirillaceae bacterium]
MSRAYSFVTPASTPALRPASALAASFRYLLAGVVRVVSAKASSIARGVLLIMLASIGSLSIGTLAEAQTTREQVLAFLDQVEVQIERIGTAQGRFMQISDAGQIVRGDIFINRPGRMRFDYDDPSPALLVADGRFIGTYNTKDETSAHRQINQTPLKFLLNSDPDLANGVKVLKIERVAESVLVTMRDRRNPNQGQLILVLDTQTLELRAWQVIDDKGDRTTVRLESMAYGVPLPAGLFQRPGF